MPTYVALKNMRVQTDKKQPNGRPVMRDCIPGDEIPEAGGWKTNALRREIACGRVGVLGVEQLSGPALLKAVSGRTPVPLPDPQAARNPRRRRAAEPDMGEFASKLAE